MQTPHSKPRYQIYPSLLDAFDAVRYSDDVWEMYWGNSENPPHTLEEFALMQEADLIDKINRVKKDLPKADIGTAFNEVVDCLIIGKQSEKYPVERVHGAGGQVVALRVSINDRSVILPLEMCREFADRYRESVPQVSVEGEIETIYGRVRLYGYLDELNPDSVSDIKTTGMYKPMKFRQGSQHLVYPYCLHQMGQGVDTFHYDVAHIRSTISDDTREIDVVHLGTYRETYTYDHASAEERIRERCEALIGWIEQHRDAITDKRIFNEN